MASCTEIDRKELARSSRQSEHHPLTRYHIVYLHLEVFIVTGASSGVGEQLAQILYQHNAKVYVAARSEAKASKAISQMKSRFPESLGQLAFLHLDLDDLTTIKASADDFLRKEARLDVLWNNAGVMIPPQGSKTKQGYEAQLGTNNVAPFLFTKLLHPILARTAQQAPANSVRVVWVSSSGAELMSPKGGIDFDNLDYKTDKSPMVKYSVSKAGNVLHASEFAKRAKGEGIVSVVGALAFGVDGAAADALAELESGESEDGASAPYA